MWQGGVSPNRERMFQFVSPQLRPVFAGKEVERVEVEVHPQPPSKMVDT